MNTYTGLASSSDFFKASLKEDNFHVLSCFSVTPKRILPLRKETLDNNTKLFTKGVVG